MSAEPIPLPSREPVPAGAGTGSTRPLSAAFLGFAAALAWSAVPHAVPFATHARHGLLAGYTDGAPAGFSGGFMEDSCQACHFGADVNSGPGTLTITGVPEQFTAGERYRVTLTLSRPGMALGGFQLTTRFTDGGGQAGTLAPAEGEVQRIGIQVQNGIQYAGQRQSGTVPAAPDTARWTLDWTAPKAGGPVLFNASANAADKDDTAQGDYVYTATAQTAPSGLPARR